ncbi:MAG: transcriptional regulator, CdaR [Herbinix sp.]|jgi:carbohydrate diacid regulator|nr:transcriptional regulator, CdaR [Herbinix sp.]
MYISKRNATYIVQEISKIIGEKINMMNADGVIIASTDVNRIGDFHAAAKELIDHKLQEVVVKSEREYEGARPGLNLAINFQDEIVGVIGVTGPYQEVSKYGQIIKKMTEILILDQYYKEQKDRDKRIKERYLDEWMFGESKNITPQFVKHGNSMQIDITLPRRIMAVSFITLEHNTAEEQSIIDSSEKIIIDLVREDKNSITLKSGMELLCAIEDCSDLEMIKLAEHMKKEIESRYRIKFCCGIDSNCEGYAFIHNSVIKAVKALKTSLRSPQKGIRLYTSITMEIFQSELSSNIKREYITRIFKDCTLEEIDQWIGLLNIFYEEEGSIAAAAQRLFIHKNTLQYKLNKIRERTGYDPRSIRYSSLFYNAIHFYQDERDKMIF